VGEGHEHEESHKADCLKSNPDICKDRKPDTPIWSDYKTNKSTEKKACDAEKKCLNKAKGKDPKLDCEIEARIIEVEKHCGK